jgi:hypothetical protein
VSHDSCDVLLERVADLEASLASYRALACAALERLHDLTKQIDRLRAQHHHLIHQYRALRAQTPSERSRA